MSLKNMVNCFSGRISYVAVVFAATMLFGSFVLDAMATTAPEVVMRVESFGIKSDSAAVQTVAIQKAIDSVGNVAGGGKLVFGPGAYVSGTLRLPSDVEIHLERNATLFGSVDPFDYSGYAEDYAGSSAASDKCSKSMFGLIVSDGTHNIRLSGRGTVDGRGLLLALAIDSLHHTGVRVDPDYNKRRMRPSLRPKLFDFENVDGLQIDSLRLRSSASWGVSIGKCSNVIVDGIDFENRAYWNNDGIDIADCKHVLIRGCRINSADDGIVLKSFDPADGNFDIRIEDCDITSSANALKMGTESFGGFRKVRISNVRVSDTFRSAVAIESVDGAVVEDVVVDGVEAVNTGNAFFIRLGHRRGDAPGSMRDVTIRNLTCHIPFGRPDIDYDLRGPDINTIHNPFPNSITGIPEAHVENVTLENVAVSHPGRGTRGMAYVGRYRIKDIPEYRDSYPEFHMFGELPAWGIFARHVDGLVLRNVDLTLRAPDYRDPVVTDDVSGFVVE